MQIIKGGKKPSMRGKTKDLNRKIENIKMKMLKLIGTITEIKYILDCLNRHWKWQKKELVFLRQMKRKFSTWRTEGTLFRFKETEMSLWDSFSREKSSDYKTQAKFESLDERRLKKRQIKMNEWMHKLISK